MLFFHSLPCNATEYLASYRTDYCLPPPERRSSNNNCPHRSGVGSYNNLRAYRPSSPASTMQNPRFDRRRRPNYWSTVQLYGKMLHPNVAKPNVQSRCRLCVRYELADLTSTKPIVFASKLETHQRTPALGSFILSLETHRSHHRSRPHGGSYPSGNPNRKSIRTYCTKFSLRLDDTRQVPGINPHT